MTSNINRNASPGFVFGRRPVWELLDSGLSVLEVIIADPGHGSILADIIDKCAEKGIHLRTVSPKELDRLAAGINHQGVAARFTPPELIDVPGLLDIAEHQDRREFPLILLDGIEDPHNLGAIIRSVEVLSGGGVIIRERRSAWLSPAAVKSSAGAALRVPTAETVNINQAIKTIQEAGYWVYGLDPGGSKTLWDLDLSVPAAFVLGSEGSGLARLTRERCDELVSIPIRGKIGSLNVSVAAGVVLAEWARQHCHR
ncbi:MAG: 23S rRNA (guanosine(2251)-2'-O)-methyltransferase RlmB [Calditrichota bacterium]